ncbi:MAG: hypothetical protein PHV93_02445 [Candidatus Pacebacteria bacterium]|nr:hypothetical protein [Candidatus Paceibacterota bacterium]
MTYFFTQQKELEKTVDALPAAKKPWAGGDLTDLIYEIGNKYSLTLEKDGVIFELIQNIIAGKMLSANFESELRKSIEEEDLSDDQLKELVGVLNEKIFVPIRTAMRKASEPKEEVMPTREDVLHGIENPVKTAHLLAEDKTPAPVPSASSVPPAVIRVASLAPTPPVPAQPPTETPPPPIQQTAIEIKPHMDIMEAKLGSAVKMPVTEVKVAEKPPAIVKTPRPIAPQRYTVDPYKEPPTA